MKKMGCASGFVWFLVRNAELVIVHNTRLDQPCVRCTSPLSSEVRLRLYNRSLWMSLRALVLFIEA